MTVIHKLKLILVLILIVILILILILIVITVFMSKLIPIIKMKTDIIKGVDTWSLL